MNRIATVMAVLILTTPVWAQEAVSPPAPVDAKAQRAEEKEAKKAAKAEAKQTRFEEEGIYYTNGRMDFVKIETMKKGEIKDRTPQHPATIVPDQLETYLKSILVSEKDILKKSPEIIQVFNDKAADFLAPIIAKAFSKVQPDQMVVFSWLTKDPMAVIRNDRIVIGECWIQDNHLHIQFNKLLAKLTGDYDKRGNFNFVINNAKGLRTKLLPSAVVSVAGRGGREAIIDMGGDFASLTAPDSVAGGDSAKARATRNTQDRLSDLDQLRKDKMITEAEYQAKRKVILDSL